MPPSTPDLAALGRLIDHCMLADRRALARRLHGLRQRERAGKPVDRSLAQLQADIDASRTRLAERRLRLPRPDYPPELPVSARRDAIAAAIANHQVVVIAGETGSGKTTQIPKICLELGRGVAGFIGHTQPRRIAARSVAGRIAAELNTPLGTAVGFKIRFTDRTGPDSFVKLMTDGILLAEVQQDRWLTQYDTLIIDEAHERSLNIDFLLGYLKRLLPQRPDLKLIITSATINTGAFSAFFDGAPIIEVSGRAYPVEVRYRPVLGDDEDSRDRDQPQAICDAVDELTLEDPLGDILVFLPGEREIREAAEALRKHRMRHTEVLPLFSRLSAAEQDRIFQSHSGRRIVLATNVAETSLTVPGIRFVIDTGYARLSRYSHRTKVQRLPIEPVSRAAANQRAGRCGRLGPGVCVRLYAEADFNNRPEHTDPEILRTNLASVILQMASMDLGPLDDFPFMAAPDGRFISDGYRLLQELKAVDGERCLTDLGRRLARLPVDPRLGRMLLAAGDEGCLTEVAVIAAALAVQDPRERPADAQQAADQAHARFHDERSDFLAYLNLWNHYHEQARHLSTSKLRKLCRDEFLSYVRLREWHDIHGQLVALARELTLRPNEQPADYPAIHRALLTGLLGNVAVKEEEPPAGAPGQAKRRERFVQYQGARNNRLAIFPGSSLARKPPKWLMAAELVETSRLFARTVASIDPVWLESLAAHLIKKSWSEPHWEKRPAEVAAFEQQSLYGLIVVARRRVNYGPIDPATSRELFIRHALVQGEYDTRAPFLRHNRALVAEVEEMEAKTRRRDVLVEEQVLYDFYDQRLPAGVYSGRTLDRWRRDAERAEPRVLFMERALLLQEGAAAVSGEQFPDLLTAGGLSLPLEYRFEPGHPADGVTVVVPLAGLARLGAHRGEWLVPGLLEAKIIALIKSLPKALRRNFVPAVNFARAAIESLVPGDQPLTEALAQQLRRMTGVQVPEEAWDPGALPEHLFMNYRVVDERGKPMQEGRDLAALGERLEGRVRESLAQAPVPTIEREGLTGWDFGELPESVEVRRQGLTLRAWPALVEQDSGVAIRLAGSPEEAERLTRPGLRRLFLLESRDKVRHLQRHLPGLQGMCLQFATVGRCDELRDDIIAAAAERVLFGGEGGLPRTREEYLARAEPARARLVEEALTVAAQVAEVLALRPGIERVLKGTVPPLWLESLADVRRQVDRLIYPGFVSATPAPWLGHLPRYLKAVERRLERLRSDPDRDRRLTRELTPVWNRCWERVGKPGPIEDPALARFRWLLEELRVSLFAQELKTLEPVSVTRLEKVWRQEVA